MNASNGNGSNVRLRVVRADQPLPTRPSDFASFVGRARWFWKQYRDYEPLPLWWVAREWLRNEMRWRQGR